MLERKLSALVIVSVMRFHLSVERPLRRLSGSFIFATAGNVYQFQFPMSVAIEWLSTAHRSQQQERVVNGLRLLAESDCQFKNLDDYIWRWERRPLLRRLNR